MAVRHGSSAPPNDTALRAGTIVSVLLLPCALCHTRTFIWYLLLLTPCPGLPPACHPRAADAVQPFSTLKEHPELGELMPIH